MAEGKPNPYRGQRALARYRFEYERKRTWTKAGLIVVAGSCVIAIMVGVTFLRQPGEQPEVQAQTAPKVETPRALAMLAAEPTPVEPEGKPAPPPVPALTTTAGTSVERSGPVQAKAETKPPAGPSAAPPMELAAAPPPPATPASPVPVPAAAPATVEVRLAEAVPAPAQPPPADPCATAGGAVERMVCADPELRAADEAMGAAFRRARQLTDKPWRLDKQQDRWREQRDRLGSDRTAVLAHYQARYRQLWPPVRRVTPPIGAQRAGFIPW